MAGVVGQALRRLMPKGRAWTGAQAVIDGLELPLERARTFLQAVESEAIPLTASETIDEWLELLNISTAPGSTLGTKRKLASAAYVSIGGQALDYINDRISDAFPNAYVDENEAGDGATSGFTLYYYVRGFVPFSRDILTVRSMLVRIAPLHLVPVYEVRGVYDGDVARCGIGSTGRAITGRRETAWKETDGEVARCGVGVVGIGITGRIPE